MKKLKRNFESLVFSVCMAGIFLFPCMAFAQKEAASGIGEKETVRQRKGKIFFAERRKNMPGRRGGRPGFFLGKLSPEEHAELRRLSASGDKENFHSKLRELRKKYASEEDKKVFLLEEKYHAAKTQAEKDTVLWYRRIAVSHLHTTGRTHSGRLPRRSYQRRTGQWIFLRHLLWAAYCASSVSCLSTKPNSHRQGSWLCMLSAEFFSVR